ncbi:MAG: oxidoreductase [Sphingomonadales bacterium 32-64-17]|nr:MAG: oxidoreductase [Sphingomonadales bacterium 32-64-17]
MPDNLGTSPDDVQFRFRDDEVVDHAAVTVDAFLDQSNAAAVRIEPGDDARELLPHLERIKLVEVNFPGFMDGRGYSSARVLREAGYEGEIRAVGEVLIDQLAIMRRCGFDAFAPVNTLDEADAERAFNLWNEVYQKTTDGRAPIWQKRHG